jgi:acyl-coenzyme A synthetase/AMP-(fatty) acid ligase
VCDWLDFTPDDVGVHITPMYYGTGLRSGVINALLAGRSIVCLPHADIEAFFASIEQFQPTFLAAGFSVFRAILRRAPEFRAAVAQSRFRFMLSGSGRLDPDDADRLEQLFGAPMLTGLSSTETNRIAVDPLPPRLRKRGSVGLPLVNEVGILDGVGEIRSNGGPGEIVVRGPMVFSGISRRSRAHCGVVRGRMVPHG